MQSHDYREHFIQRLKQARLRVTQPRIAVFECLSSSKRPLTPKSLLEKLRADKSLMDVDQVSVYRILETFKELGLVHQVAKDGGFLACNHLRCNHGMHVIAHCNSCGLAQEGELPEALGTELRKRLRKQLGFTMDEHYFQTAGLCRQCQKAPA